MRNGQPVFGFRSLGTGRPFSMRSANSGEVPVLSAADAASSAVSPQRCPTATVTERTAPMLGFVAAILFAIALHHPSANVPITTPSHADPPDAARPWSAWPCTCPGWQPLRYPMPPLAGRATGRLPCVPGRRLLLPRPPPSLAPRIGPAAHLGRGPVRQGPPGQRHDTSCIHSPSPSPARGDACDG